MISFILVNVVAVLEISQKYRIDSCKHKTFTFFTKMKTSFDQGKQSTVIREIGLLVLQTCNLYKVKERGGANCTPPY